MGCSTPNQLSPQYQYPYPNHTFVIKPLKSLNEPYYDEEFKNNSSQVTDNQDQIKVHRDYKWKRASETETQTDLFLQDFESNNIIQGALKDQYLIQALQKLVRLDAIKRIFLTQNISSRFQVCINICGEWNVIVLDDYFPYSGERPLFSHHKLNDLWVMIIEKAFAKIYGYYTKLEHSGNKYEIMKDLTGCPYILDNKGSLIEISVQKTTTELFPYDVDSYLISHSLPIRKNKSQSFIYEMNVPQNSQMYLTVSQSDLKFSRNDHYGQLTLIVCKQDFSEIIDSKYDQLRDITLQLKLKQGVYIVYIEVQWQQVTDYKLNIQSYGPPGVFFKEKKGDPSYILDQMIKTHSNSLIHKQQENLKYTIQQLGRYYYAYFQNSAQNQIIEINLKINQKLVAPCSLHYEFKTYFKLKPNQFEIIKFQILLENKQNHKFEIDEDFNMNVIKSLTDQQLIEKCLKEEFINRNQIIKIYKYSDDHQIGYLYKNDSNKKYYETKTVQLKNFQCKDAINNIINIEINPNEQKLIRFDIIDWNDETYQFQCEDQYRFE